MRYLKIKDNVDLKELENFGFEKQNGIYTHTRILENRIAWKLYVTGKNHYLQAIIYESCNMAKVFQTIIYDLIKADLVEVVEE